MARTDVRNVAIIAHVDHGKTTLVDGLLRQAGTFRRGEVVAERALDSIDLERERGITILSKCTSVTWKDVRINLVDTPGHADFGGEVERVLGMVDAVLLVVDAVEGPMPQTRFVTAKAFELGLPALVVVNKIDRPAADPEPVVDKVFDLFAALGASDQQLDFPIIYASGREGYAVADLADPREDLAPLLDLLLERVAPASGDESAPFCMQVATLDYDDFLGYMAIGRVQTGQCRVGDRLLLGRDDGQRIGFRVQKLLGFQGLRRFELVEARAGDIVAVTGMGELEVGDTLCDVTTPRVLPRLKVDAPTMSANFCANDSPFAGREGKWVTSRKLRERLFREVRSNIALRVAETEDAGVFEVSGRGELHLSILIETMRREGYEFCVSQPRVITKRDAAGNLLEPYEDVVIDMDEQFSGAVIEELGRRLGKLVEMEPAGSGRVRVRYRIPARGLIGYRSQFLTDTRGTGTFYSVFADYDLDAGPLRSRQNGVLIAAEQGTTAPYALFGLQARGALFVGPQVEVYGGMIVGEHSRGNDLVVNPCRAKKLNNIRTHAHDEKLILTPPRQLSLETSLEFLNEDEYLEVTPRSLRLRKIVLDHGRRRRREKGKPEVGERLLKAEKAG